MKQFFGIVIALALIIGLAAPAFANECPTVIEKIEQMMESADISDEKKDTISELVNKGEELHNAGQHDQAMEVLNKALAMLGQ